MGDMFDDYIPFREALDEIVELLSEQAPALLTLPQYKDEENFVEGAIQWKNGNIGVYFETWDAYLLLHSRSRELLDAALPLIISKAKIRE